MRATEINDQEIKRPKVSSACSAGSCVRLELSDFAGSASLDPLIKAWIA